MRETDNEGSYLERSEASVLAPGFFCIQGVYVCQVDKRISVLYSQHSFTLYTYACSMCNFLIAKLLAQLWETEFVTVLGKPLGA